MYFKRDFALMFLVLILAPVAYPQTVSIVAGDGTQAFTGDGGPATGAGIGIPLGVATDSAGNFYIADSLSNRIRKVNTSGIISTYAGGVRRHRDARRRRPCYQRIAFSRHACRSRFVCGPDFAGSVSVQRDRTVCGAEWE